MSKTTRKIINKIRRIMDLYSDKMCDACGHEGPMCDAYHYQKSALDKLAKELETLIPLS